MKTPYVCTSHFVSFYDFAKILMIIFAKFQEFTRILISYIVYLPSLPSNHSMIHQTQIIYQIIVMFSKIDFFYGFNDLWRFTTYNLHQIFVEDLELAIVFYALF
jgi:hypothetical protein